MNDLFQKTCPDCGRPLHIKRMSSQLPSSGPNQRFFSCTHFGCTYSSDFIDGHESLSIETMALDMALGSFFNNAAEQGKRQASFRRLAGGLKKLSHGKQYLSDTELQTLDEASRLLQRLGSAAQLAKKEKKRLELEKQQREAVRLTEARIIIHSFVDHEDTMESALNALTLSDIHSSSLYDRAFSDDDIQHLVKNARPEQILKSLKDQVTQSLQSQINKSADTISFQDQSVDDCVKQLRVKYNEQREASRSLHRQLLEALQTALTVETSDKVERLKTPFKEDFY
jgi:hypothetical protein